MSAWRVATRRWRLRARSLKTAQGVAHGLELLLCDEHLDGVAACLPARQRDGARRARGVRHVQHARPGKHRRQRRRGQRAGGLHTRTNAQTHGRRVSSAARGGGLLGRDGVQAGRGARAGGVRRNARAVCTGAVCLVCGAKSAHGSRERGGQLELLATQCALDHVKGIGQLHRDDTPPHVPARGKRVHAARNTKSRILTRICASA